MSESGGTISFSRWRKPSDGGSSVHMLKTLGSISSLWPATGPLTLLVLLSFTPDRLRDLDTKPGTEALRIWSRSSCSVARLVDFLSIPANLNTRYIRRISEMSGEQNTRHAFALSRLVFWNTLASVAFIRPSRADTSPSVAR